MKRDHLLSLSTIILLSATSLHAIKFEALGYKAISMGGASVASSTGSLAAYNNPALLSKQPYDVEISIGVGASEYDHGAVNSAKALEDTGFIDTVDTIVKEIQGGSVSQATLKTLNDGRDILIDMDGNYVTVAPQVYLGLQVQGFGMGVYASSDTKVTAIVDQDKTALIFKDGKSGYTEVDSTTGHTTASDETTYKNTSIEYALKNGDTYLDAKGAALVEVPIAYGHNFETNIGNIMVGGALKYMQAITYIEELKVDNSGEVDGDVKKDATSTNFGVDLGLAYQPAFSYDLTFGLVLKNLNSPSFDFADGQSYNVDMLARAGVAYNIFDSLQIAADIDLTSNNTLNPEIDNQMLGGGIMYEPFNNLFALSIRGGLMQNIAGDTAGLIYTAGLGIGVKWFQIDLSGEMSGNKNTFQGYTVPTYAKANIALVSRW